MNAVPIGVLFDKTSGMIWIAEGIGKIASIDPIRNYKISEYPLMAMDNHTRYSPTELFMDTFGDNNLFISNHDNHTVSSFNTKLKTFRSYPVFNPNALPFGMAMDKNGYLWMAEHTTNKIAVIDPKTGYIREIQLPSISPYIQFLTSDSKGNIWFVEEHGNSLGVIASPVSKAS
jgi:streptogramin lyase